MNGILLVEDEAIALSLKDVLELELALPVTVARTVGEAVRELQEGGPFDVLVIDIMMTPGRFPGEDRESPLRAGYQLAQKVRSGAIEGIRTQSIVPILFHTGIASPTLLDEISAKFGPANVFEKPTDGSPLVTRIREVLEKRCLVVEQVAQGETSLTTKLTGCTPFLSVDGVPTTEAAIASARAVRYAVTLVMTEAPAEELSALEELVGRGQVLVKPEAGFDLPRQVTELA